MKNAFGRIAVACWSGGLLVVSAAAQNPTFSLIPDGDYVRECIGGPNEGAVCDSAADCCNRLHVCEGGANHGADCAGDADCYPGGTCVQQCFCSFVITAAAGDEILTEIYASDWSPEDQGLLAWTASVDMNGFHSGDAGKLAPLKGARPCTTDVDCTDIQSRCKAGVCNDNAECDEDDDCSSWGPEVVPCIGERCDIAQGVAAGALIDLSRPDYVYFGIPGAFVITDLTDIRYGGMLVDPHRAPVYSPPPRYCATLVLTVSDDAWGTFTVPFRPPIEMIDQSLVVLSPVDTEPLMIRITGLPPVVSTDPPDCAIDARQTSEPDGSSPDGWDSVAFKFDGDISGIESGHFGIRQNPPGGLPIAILSITRDFGANTVTTNFNRRISRQKWTCVEYLPRSCEVCIAHLPVDVDSDYTSSASDILALVECLSGASTCEDWKCDLDRSGVCAAPDVLRAVDLLGGAEAYSPGWLGVQMLGTGCPPGPCP